MDSNNPEQTVIGIDLGTTFCCVAALKNGKIEVVANTSGNRTTPSCINFNKDGYIVGDNERLRGTTVYDTKRLIGRQFKDDEVQKRLKYWPFTVIDKDGKPKIVVKEKETPEQFFPEEISAKILGYLVEFAKDYMAKPISGAVVTVPAYFNISQREATKAACRIAGLNVLRIINEPTAAAYAIYSQNTEIEQPTHVLVYDLGGGTFDVSVLKVDATSMKVLATRGNNNLGGEDFTTKLVKFIIDDMKRKHNIDIFQNDDSKILYRRIHNICEKTKKNLSQLNSYELELQAFNNKSKNCSPGDYTKEITKTQFIQLNLESFHSTLKVIELSLEDANLTKNDINTVVLVGGSTRIPYIKQMLESYFNRSEKNSIEFKNSQNPDETIAIGAALFANKLVNDQKGLQTPIEKMLVDVTPLSLGIETNGGKMSVIIKRNTTIPVEVKKQYSNPDYQTSLKIAVYQGERPLVKDNYDLGSFTLTNLSPQPKGKLDIEVTFNVDADGTLKVKAQETISKAKNELTLKINGCLDEEEILQIIEEAEMSRKVREKEKRLEMEKNKLHTESISIRNKIRYSAQSKEDIQNNLEECEDCMKQLSASTALTEEDIERLAARLRNLKQELK